MKVIIVSNLYQRIKSQRLSCGYTLAEVADKLGVKEATVQRYESGEIKNIKHATITKLASIFNTTPAYLMGWEDDASSYKKNDAITDIILRLRSDADFLALVEKLNSLPADKLSAIRSLLT